MFGWGEKPKDKKAAAENGGGSRPEGESPEKAPVLEPSEYFELRDTGRTTVLQNGEFTDTHYAVGRDMEVIGVFAGKSERIPVRVTAIEKDSYGTLKKTTLERRES